MTEQDWGASQEELVELCQRQHEETEPGQEDA